MSVACTIGNLYGGDLLVRPELAKALVAEGIIAETTILGHYNLIDGQDDHLWYYLRRQDA